MATKTRTGKHKKGKVQIAVWDDEEFKEILERDAQNAGLPNWSLSDQIRYELRERRGLWKEPYRPASGTPNRKP